MLANFDISSRCRAVRVIRESNCNYTHIRISLIYCKPDFTDIYMSEYIFARVFGGALTRKTLPLLANYRAYRQQSGPQKERVRCEPDDRPRLSLGVMRTSKRESLSVEAALDV